MAEQTAFKALLDLASRTRQTAKGLPAQVDIKPHWSGVGFDMLGHRFVAPMGEVSEMLEVPSYTRLPGVQPWVMGVANVRGRLLPVFDLVQFFGGQLQGPRKQRRILIMEMDDLYSGLLVDRVYGMQHFPVDTYTESPGDVDKKILPFAQGSYRHAGNEWTVFDMTSLARDPRFINAARE